MCRHPATKEFNLNDSAIVYPNDKGWAKIIELVGRDYAESCRTQDNGYKEELWSIMNNLGSMMYMGQDYFENMEIIFPYERY